MISYFIKNHWVEKNLVCFKYEKLITKLITTFKNIMLYFSIFFYLKLFKIQLYYHIAEIKYNLYYLISLNSYSVTQINISVTIAKILKYVSQLGIWCYPVSKVLSNFDKTRESIFLTHDPHY